MLDKQFWENASLVPKIKSRKGGELNTKQNTKIPMIHLSLYPSKATLNLLLL